jgi:hypothetical protein
MSRKHASNKGDYDIGKREKNVNNHKKGRTLQWGRKIIKFGEGIRERREITDVIMKKNFSNDKKMYIGLELGDKIGR